MFTKKPKRLPEGRSTVTTISVSGRNPIAEPQTANPPAVQIPAHLVHGLSDSLHARADELHRIADVIRRYEPLTLDVQRLYVGRCLDKGGEFCDAWRDLARYLCGREDLVGALEYPAKRKAPACPTS